MCLLSEKKDKVINASPSNQCITKMSIQVLRKLELIAPCTCIQNLKKTKKGMNSKAEKQFKNTSDENASAW